MVRMRNSINFGGVNSADFGIYISGEGVFDAPKRAVEMIAVPGRNGEIALDQGYWENIEVTYPAFNYEEDLDTFAERLSAFRNAICSLKGYQRLSDTFHPDEYRMAVYSEGLEVTPIKYNTAANFDLKFDCKPQRWLTSGETAVTIGEWGETETISGDIVEIDNPNGIESVKSLKVSLEPIQDLNGYDKPWVGGAGKNKLPITATTQTINGVTFTVNNDGTVTANGTAKATLVLYLNDPGDLWSSGSYIMNGCPSGGSLNTYAFRIYRENGNTLASDTGNGASFTGQSGLSAGIVVWRDTTLNNAVFKPMIRLASETDAAFEPYTNICPISGRTEVNTQIIGKNLIDPSGVTNEALDSEGEAIPSTLDALTDFIELLPNTDYTFRVSTNNRGGAVGVYDKDKNFLGFRYIPIEDGAEYAGAYFNTGNNIKYGRAVYSSNATDAILCVGTDYSVTYAPYVAPHEYHTDLGRTVYGGTLDVVSGVLTVDKVMLEWLSSSNFGKGGATNVDEFFLRPPATDTPVSGIFYDADHIICSHANNTASVSTETGVYTRLANQQLRIIFPLSMGMTLANFKTWLDEQQANGTPLQVCYMLATPQTYQLTPQQIDLLLGTNNVWSDGVVSVEYGQNPSILYNPTLYDAGPLLMVEGYGTIDIDGNEVVIRDSAVGEITIEPRGTFETEGLVLPLDTSLLQNGDPITFNGLSLLMRVSGKSTISNVTLIDSSSDFTSRTRGLSGSQFDLLTSMDSVTIQKGETRVLDHTVTARITAGSIVSDVTCTIRVILSAEQLRVARTVTTAEGYHVLYQGTTTSSFYSRISGVSSLQLGNPTYIDCENGDAYRVDDGAYSSLNKLVTFGPVLPTIKPGGSVITFDSTITSLQVRHNWWKL